MYPGTAVEWPFDPISFFDLTHLVIRPFCIPYSSFLNAYRGRMSLIMSFTSVLAPTRLLFLQDEESNIFTAQLE